MRVVHLLVPAVASIFCVATLFAQGSTYAQQNAQFVMPPVITYGTPRVVQSTPITRAYAPQRVRY